MTVERMRKGSCEAGNADNKKACGSRAERYAGNCEAGFAEGDRGRCVENYGGNCAGACRNGCRGSYTVEAAAVVSFTFLVLAALIIAVFFVHDRAVFQGLACEAAAVGSNFITREECVEAAEAVKKGISESRFLGSRNLAGNIGIGEKTANASWKAVFPVPGMVMRYLSGGSLNISCAWSCKIPDPADIIRKIRGAEMIVENLK